MIGLVLVSHSAKLAEGLQELIAQMQPAVPVRAAGGAADGSLGTSAEAIHRAIVDLGSLDGVLVLIDLGSAAMSAEIAVEWLDEVQRDRVILSDAPLVEGAVIAATEAPRARSIAGLAEAVQQARRFPKLTAETMAEKEEAPAPADVLVTLWNRAGLHARSAAQVLKTAARFEAKVTLYHGKHTANARSLTELLCLGGRKGDTLRIRAEGDDAQTAITAIKDLIESGFGEE